MIKLIHWLIFGTYCDHTWEVIREYLITNEYDRVIGVVNICRCSKCKKLKKMQV